MIETYGKHRLQIGDIVNGIDDLMQGERADVIWTDPPWGDSIIKMFTTMARRDNNGKQYEDHTNDELLNALFEIIIRYGRNHVVIDYGTSFKDQIIAMAEDYGLKYYHTIPCTYGNRKKALDLHTHLFLHPEATVKPLPRRLLESCAFAHGMECCQSLLIYMLKEDQILLDPFCGHGLFAKEAIKLGGVFYGNEWNAHRASKCRGVLKKG